jgi:hypothetical protein
MKKLIIILAGAVAMSSIVSCKKYLADVQPSPNEPENASPNVLLAGLEMATFVNYTGTNARRSSVFVQQIAGTGFQMTDIHNYLVVESDVDNDWQTLYSGALINADEIITKHGAGNPHYSGIAKVLKAMNLGLVADMWGDAPSSEISQGIDNLNPKFETQDVLYGNIQKILSEAISDLAQAPEANKLLPTFDDYMFNGDVQHWTQIAYVLKARYANRLSKRSPTQSATDALTYLQAAYAAGFAGVADDANAIFGSNGNESNQWFNFNDARAGYMKMGAFIVDTMNSMSDPRLPFYADTLEGGIYAGGELSNPDPDNSSDIGPYLDQMDAPVSMVTFMEAKFIEAEASLRAGNTGAAATAFNEGVKASIERVTGGPDAAFETLHAAETAGTISQDKIMFQKYIAMFGQVEAWTDWRRTDIPNLQPNPNAALNGIPHRLPTPRDERTYNPNAIVNSNILFPVWFESK